jgi:hypothetical protein
MRKITPGVDLNYLRPIVPIWGKLDWFIYFLSAFFCFGLTAILCAISGTLINEQSDPRKISFFSDIWNITFYIAICPLYVTFCIRLILLLLEGPRARVEVNEEKGEILYVDQIRNRTILSLSAIFLLSSLLITNYISDAVKIEKTYWFLTEIAQVRTLNVVGFYYIVLNFSLLFLTFLGGASFISISIDDMRVAKNVIDSDRPLEFKTYKRRLERLIKAYIFGAFLTILYGLNMLIWKWSPLGENSNLAIGGAAFTVIGLFFVAIPKRYIQHVWAEYDFQKETIAGQDDEEGHYKNVITNWKVLWIINIGITTVLSGWFFEFYDLKEPEVLKILHEIFR